MTYIINLFFTCLFFFIYAFFLSCLLAGGPRCTDRLTVPLTIGQMSNKAKRKNDFVDQSDVQRNKKKRTMEQKTNYVIYKIVFPNNKHYIGCTIDLKDRKKSHIQQAKLKHPKCTVHKALKKFNMIDTFELIVIDNSKSKEEMFEKEIFYIQHYNSHIKNKKGYNMTLGGEGNYGYIYTKADRKKMSEKAIQQFSNPEAREKARERTKAHYENNPEAREKVSQIRKAYYENNPEAREKASKGQLQRFSDPEQIEKARERAIKQFSDAEAREKASQIKKEHYENNPEAGKLHGQKLKAHYENKPEAREQMSQKLKAHYENNRKLVNYTVKK